MPISEEDFDELATVRQRLVGARRLEATWDVRAATAARMQAKIRGERQELEVRETALGAKIGLQKGPPSE